MQEFCDFFLQKIAENLHMSKKSSNFAPDFGKSEAFSPLGHPKSGAIENRNRVVVQPG